MLIESDDVRECISRIFTEVHNSDKSFKVYSEINNILFRLSDDISAIEAEQAGKNAQCKYNEALDALKDR